MNLDFCNISTELSASISLLSILFGAFLGYVLQRLFKNAGNGLESSMTHNLGGCLIPVVFAVLTGVVVAKLLPEDPCGGAYTPDSVFVPLQVIPLVAIAAVTVFWFKVLRK